MRYVSLRFAGAQHRERFEAWVTRLVGDWPMMPGALRCEGVRDERGRPVCDGPHPRLVRVRRRADGPRAPFRSAFWCARCRVQALTMGHEVSTAYLPTEVSCV